MSDYDVALARCGMLDEDALARPWSWRGRQMDVRYALYRTLEDAQEAYVRVSAEAHPESRRILALAQHAFGSLRALLAGLPGALLDKPPRAGEWPIRETLGHMLAVEQRYALQTKYAVDRTDADPMRIPDNRLPPTAPATVGGEIDAVLARLADARAETGRWLGDVTAGGDDPTDDVGGLRHRRAFPAAPIRGSRRRAHDPVREDLARARMAPDRRSADRAARWPPSSAKSRAWERSRTRARSRRGWSSAWRR